MAVVTISLRLEGQNELEDVGERRKFSIADVGIDLISARTRERIPLRSAGRHIFPELISCATRDGPMYFAVAGRRVERISPVGCMSTSGGPVYVNHQQTLVGHRSCTIRVPNLIVVSANFSASDGELEPLQQESTKFKVVPSWSTRPSHSPTTGSRQSGCQRPLRVSMFPSPRDHGIDPSLYRLSGGREYDDG